VFSRNVANVTMDLDDVEDIDFRALGGADNIVVGDLSGTDVASVGPDLRGPNGGGDGAADTVTVNGTQGNDVFGAAGDAGGVNVFGLTATFDISFQEQANDRLTLNALGGEDTVDATSLEADGIQLTMNSGLGADLFLGSEGDDLVNGGDGAGLQGCRVCASVAAARSPTLRVAHGRNSHSHGANAPKPPHAVRASAARG
jgi:hypothetical protein